MRNAKDELLEHVGGMVVEFIRIAYRKGYYEKPLFIDGSLGDSVKLLDFSYDSGFGSQELFGFVLYSDGTWSEREEYDGQEWWVHRKPPTINTELDIFGDS